MRYYSVKHFQIANIVFVESHLKHNMLLSVREKFREAFSLIKLYGFQMERTHTYLPITSTALVHSGVYGHYLYPRMYRERLHYTFLSLLESYCLYCCWYLFNS